jgi:phospholipid transport system transporter-binding protein
LTFRPSPSLTIDNARSAMVAGMQAIASGEQVIDFGELNTVDSTAVAVLLAWQRAALTQSSALSFINLPSTLQKLVSLYGVETLLAIPAVGD